MGRTEGIEPSIFWATTRRVNRYATPAMNANHIVPEPLPFGRALMGWSVPSHVLPRTAARARYSRKTPVISANALPTGLAMHILIVVRAIHEYAAASRSQSQGLPHPEPEGVLWLRSLRRL